MTKRRGAAAGREPEPRPLLVGELNPLHVDPRYALFPYPTTGSGGRLQRILGLSRREYLRTFDRVNLCTNRWDPRKAMMRAMELTFVLPPRVYVLLGTKVAHAFGLPFTPFKAYYGDRVQDELMLSEVGHPLRRGVSIFAVLPHPSGLCRTWNEFDSWQRARVTLVNAGVKGIRWSAGISDKEDSHARKGVRRVDGQSQRGAGHRDPRSRP